MIAKELRGLAVPIETLKLNKRNTRKRTKANLQAISDSLEEFGQQKNVVALKDGTVMAGGGTLEAALKLGWKELAVLYFHDKEKAMRYAIADNRTAELSEWDYPELSAQFKGMIAAGKTMDDLKILGFDDFEIEPLLEGEFTVPGTDPHATEGKTISLKKDQRIIFERVAARIREAKPEERMTDAQIVMVLCDGR